MNQPIAHAAVSSRVALSADGGGLPIVDLGPLAAKVSARPREVCAALSIGTTRLYELLAAGELESYRDGGARRITVQSVARFVARRIAASQERPATAA